MAHFRKIDVRIWNDAKFNELSHLGKLIFIFLITHPGMTMLGAMRATPAGLAEELQASPEGFREAFDEVLLKGLAKVDQKASCIWLPNFLKYQSAESPNVLRNWAKQVEFIPECSLKTLAVSGLRDYAEASSEPFRKAFREAFGKDFPESVSSKQSAVSSNPPPLSKAGDGHLVDVHGANPSGINSGNGGENDF
ncbi:MAG: hypothetical protein IPJ12_13395 [Betaproteobacteria bacterium]|nr:hypothetical protein [Betaproteobacteria bacterium]